MKKKITAFEISGMRKLILFLSITVALFWILVQFVNIYYYAWVGAIFEILWLPFLAMLFIFPILSFILLAKDKFNILSSYWYSMLVTGVAILLMALKK